ncbi:MAG: hypothetical protein GY822_30510 [Deltaproteobacteria bacterium]|nr:hypothetical protein [Deltaproteobacteria bacterium]
MAGAWLGQGSSGGLEVFVLDDTSFVSLGDLVEPFPDATFDNPAPKERIRSKQKTNALPFGGALVDKRIALSAGHGWVDNGNGYGTQRSRYAFDDCGSCREITEDFYTAEVMSRYLIPLLRKMGANLVVVREPDHDTRDAIILDENGGHYSETGSWAQGSSAGGLNDTYRTTPQLA